MNHYTLRLDALDGVTRDKVVAFVKKYDEYVVVYEKAAITGKMHYQGYVRTDVRHQAYQKRVQAAFPELVGSGRGTRGAYSAAVIKDIDAYKRYIMKGTEDAEPEVVCSSIQLDIREAWQASRKVEKDKSKKSPVGNVIERGVAHFAIVAWERDVDERFKQREVCRWVMNDLIERKKPMNDFLIRNYVTAILAHNPESFNYIVERIVDKL